ncbi:MAG: MarR family transcriptional regulator [Gemmatimonadaceae bacterium]|nr:MarR family transcriptional regulator [Gemmatimonadaceae bacterium]
MNKHTQTAAEEFAERMGIAVEADGLPRIAGRIMGFLLLHDGPCRASELMERLSISHGSVSTNTRLLEQFGIVERISFPGDRATFYQLSDDPFARLLSGYLARMRRMQNLVGETRGRLPASMTVARRRLADMERFYRLSVRVTEDLMDQLATPDMTSSSPTAASS